MGVQPVYRKRGRDPLEVTQETLVSTPFDDDGHGLTLTCLRVLLTCFSFNSISALSKGRLPGKVLLPAHDPLRHCVTAGI